MSTMTSALTHDLPTRSGSAARRMKALITAEVRQFFANRTLLFLAALPIVMTVAMYYFVRRETDQVTGIEMTFGSILILFVLLFVQFYPVISAATTRRDEKVLKRLRTGEARDHEILSALVVPGMVMSVVTIAAYIVIVLLDGAPAPTSPLVIGVAVVLGLIIFAAAGLITATYTKNAEAAQMTSMPVFILAFLAQPMLRGILPDSVSALIEKTPFALVCDLADGAWLGRLTEAEMWSGLGQLAGWAIALCIAASRFRFETAR